jgi:hypothetical protein
MRGCHPLSGFAVRHSRVHPLASPHTSLSRQTGASVAALPLAPAAECQYRSAARPQRARSVTSMTAPIAGSIPCAAFRVPRRPCSLSACGWMRAAGGRDGQLGWHLGIATPIDVPAETRGGSDDRHWPRSSADQDSDLLLLIDVVPPARSDRRMMAVTMRTRIRQQERGGLLPNPALQAVDHLGRSAPSVARR